MSLEVVMAKARLENVSTAQVQRPPHTRSNMHRLLTISFMKLASESVCYYTTDSSVFFFRTTSTRVSTSSWPKIAILSQF